MTSQNVGTADLALQRGRLLERIATQRRQLHEDLQPFCTALQTVDQVVAVAQAGAAYVRAHPRAVGMLVGAFVLLRPRRAWRWARRGVVFWRIWRRMRQEIGAFKRGAFERRFSQ